MNEQTITGFDNTQMVTDPQLMLAHSRHLGDARQVVIYGARTRDWRGSVGPSVSRTEVGLGLHVCPEFVARCIVRV